MWLWVGGTAYQISRDLLCSRPQGCAGISCAPLQGPTLAWEQESHQAETEYQDKCQKSLAGLHGSSTHFLSAFLRFVTQTCHSLHLRKGTSVHPAPRQGPTSWLRHFGISVSLPGHPGAHARSRLPSIPCPSASLMLLPLTCRGASFTFPYIAKLPLPSPASPARSGLPRTQPRSDWPPGHLGWTEDSSGLYSSLNSALGAPSHTLTLE